MQNQTTNLSDNPRLLNFRKLCPEAGNVVAPFYRTGSPKEWTSDDINTFYHEFGISYYYDLRTQGEKDKCSYHKNLLTKLPVTSYYINILPPAYEVAKKVLSHSARLKLGESILFGCAAGKDSTGIVAMFILKMLGIKDELIVDDYLKSSPSVFDYVRYFYEEVRDNISKSKFIESMTPKKYVIEVILDHVKTHNLYGLT